MDPEAGAQQPLLAEQPQANPDGTIPSVQDVEHWTRRVARELYAGVSSVGLCIFFGFLTAVGLKSVGQSVAIAIVLLFLGLQVLSWYGYVNFNWGTVGGAVARRFDLNQDGRVDIKDVGLACTRIASWTLSWGIPSVLGFMVGFWVGWKIM